MEFGIATHVTDDNMDPRDLGRMVEDLGFESFFVSDHTHVPASRRSPYPMPPYGDLPRDYYRIADPFVVLGAIAAVTERIKLGTSVCLVMERDPIITAKQTATLDWISGGRLLFGVGAGWNREEMENHGVDPKTRMKVLEEKVEAIKRIWTEERAEYHGRFVNFDPIFSWPKPVQCPYPPVIVGGNGPTVLDRVVRFGDGWIPGHQKDLDDLHARMIQLQEMAAAAGRDPIPVTIMGGRAAFFERYVAMGAARCILLLEPARADVIPQMIKDAAAQVRAFRGN